MNKITLFSRAVSLLLSCSLLLSTIPAYACSPAYSPLSEDHAVPVETEGRNLHVQEAISLSFASSADQILTSGDFRYIVLTEQENQVIELVSYQGATTELTVPAEINGLPVTSIGSNAFENNTNLQTLTLPDTVTHIGVSAFQNCSGLHQINIPRSLKTVGPVASEYTGLFRGCTQLKHIDVPEGMTALPDGIFYGANCLESVTLPASLISVGKDVFHSCTDLQTLALPDTVTRIGVSAFQSCSSLYQINIPTKLETVGPVASKHTGLFRGCTLLNHIDVPEGMTALPDSIFYGADGLESVSLPASLTSVGKDAFHSCTALRTLALPDTVTCIGTSAFQDCSSLHQINIPTKLETVGPVASKHTGLFLGCTLLNHIDVPEGVAALPDGIFFGADYLESVSLPASLKSIGQSAFQDCPRLVAVGTRDGIESIGNRAFFDCVKLDYLYLPNSITDLGDNIFKGIKHLTIRTFSSSAAAIYAARCRLPIEFLDDPTGFSGSVLDPQKTAYYLDYDNATAYGYAAAILDYGFRSELTITNPSLTVLLPPHLELIPGTLMLDGTPVNQSDFVYKNDTLVIKLSRLSGHLTFSLLPIAASTATSSAAIMEFEQSDKHGVQIINGNTFRSEIFTVQTSPVISGDSIPVNGVGPADADVELSIGGTVVGTAHTNKLGIYSCSLDASGLSLNRQYTLKGTSRTPDGEELTAEVGLFRNKTVSSLTSLSMSHNGKTYDLTRSDELQHTVTIRPDQPFVFKAQFSDNTAIEKVFICSTSNGSRHRIEAFWDESSQCWVAQGYFSDNPREMPGQLSVEFSAKGAPVDIYSPVDLKNSPYMTLIPEFILDQVPENGPEDLVYTDNSVSGSFDIFSDNTHISFSANKGKIPSEITHTNAESLGYIRVEDDSHKESFVRFFFDGADSAVTTIIDFQKGQFLEYYVNFAPIDSANEAFGNFQNILSASEEAFATISSATDITTLRRSVMNDPNLSPEVRQNCLASLDTAQQCNAMAMALALTILVIPGSTPLWISIALPVLQLAFRSLANSIAEQMGQTACSTWNLPGFLLRWIMDPSGYVYDSDTGERLPGVKASIYWISFEEYDQNTPPPENIYGTQWNAEDYGQHSVLTTDLDGRYAWDVPMGWWRVKFEHPSYVTAWSHWVPVAPPQTQVNVGLKSIFSVENWSFSASYSSADIKNRNTAPVTVQVIAAAYQKDGRLITADSQLLSLGPNETISLSLSAPNKATIDELRIFFTAPSSFAVLQKSAARKH